jgi:LuxR family maltose regulon positive regulatory protein
MLAEDQSREIVLTELLNDFASLSDEWIIALDDYHVITNHAIHDSLAFILTNLPRNIHLLVTSRQQLPISLAGLRARGEVLELGPQDLKFTLDEVISFFKDVMGLDLQLEQVSILEKQTEGWIAGLQLAALSLRSQPDVNEFIEAFSSNDQFITEYLF